VVGIVASTGAEMRSSNSKTGFYRYGTRFILFATTAIGPDTPNLTWITAFEDEAARDKAWAAFAADPDWQKLSQESNKRYDPNPTVRQIRLYRSAAYSPIR
jgi:hypothetical protein